jgi:prepilin-type N-terminal cleavage/methylation domain-containing protein
MSRAFTLVELAATLVVASLLSVFALQPGDRKAMEAEDIKRLRGIGQALVIWGNSHGDQYPLPSEFDKNDTTIPGGRSAKNTTGNIFSILVFAGSLKPELLVSPLETNPAIAKCESYQFVNPKAAAVPDRALWDPAFSADFTTKGHVSYAHQQPSDKRLGRWSVSFSTSEVAVGNRGPEIAGLDLPGGGAIAPRFASPPVPAPEGSPEGTPGKGTRTCSFHSDGRIWRGQLAYNDNSVRQLNPGLGHGEALPPPSPKSDFPTYTADGQARLDVPFFDEPGDLSESNNFVGIFTEAGVSRKHFKAIWD